jgi:6-methylsalicylate decarboxylase
LTHTDFHQHVWPDEFRRLLERRTRPPYLRGRRLVLQRGGSFDVDPASYSPEVRLAELDRARLHRAVVSLPPTMEPTADLVAAWHEGALQLWWETDGRLVPLAYASANPLFPGAIIPAPRLGNSPALLRRLALQGQFAFVHPAHAPPSRPGWCTPGATYAQQMLDAYVYWLAVGGRRWPELPVVFALLAGGAAFHLERFVRRGLDPQIPTLRQEHVWLETSSYGEQALELSLRTFGAARHVFGSDAPIDRVEGALTPSRAFGSAVATALLADNPLELLPQPEARWAA